MMNVIEYVDSISEGRKKEIIAELDQINNLIQGRACWHSNMHVGAASGYFIYNLKSYFEKVLQKEFNSYLEIGVLWGGSLAFLYSSGFSGNAYGLDIFNGYYGKSKDPVSRKSFSMNPKDHMDAVMMNCSHYNGEPILIQANSQSDDFDSAIEGKISEQMDVIFIDGDHSYDGAIADYHKTKHLLKKDSVLLLDNYEMSGVQQAAAEISDEGLVECLGVWKNTTWVGIKK